MCSWGAPWAPQPPPRPQASTILLGVLWQCNVRHQVPCERKPEFHLAHNVAGRCVSDRLDAQSSKVRATLLVVIVPPPAIGQYARSHGGEGHLATWVTEFSPAWKTQMTLSSSTKARYLGGEKRPVIPMQGPRWRNCGPSLPVRHPTPAHNSWPRRPTRRRMRLLGLMRGHDQNASLGRRDADLARDIQTVELRHARGSSTAISAVKRVRHHVAGLAAVCRLRHDAPIRSVRQCCEMESTADQLP